MNEYEAAVLQFHRGFGGPEGEPFGQDRDLLKLRFALIREELEELESAAGEGEMSQIMKELADLQYVVSGFAVTYGLDLQRAFRLVHESNMTKVKEPQYSETGKLLKGPNYKAPDMSKFEERVNIQ